MGFSRQEYWSGLPFFPPGDLPDPGIEPTSLMSLALAGGFLTTGATWEARTQKRAKFLNLRDLVFFDSHLCFWLPRWVVSVGKNPPASAGEAGDLGSIPGSGRSPGEGSGNPLQYFCLGNPMDRGAWPATVYGVTESWT